MISFLGALLGFISSLVPSLIKMGEKASQDKRDKAHELQVLQLQIEREKSNSQVHLAEVQTKADAQEITMLHRTDKAGAPWVESLSATVRPIIAYGLFGLYAALKIMTFASLPEITPLFIYQAVWTEEDRCLLSAVFSFYFGCRAMQKRR